jgi:hypothetical protein
VLEEHVETQGHKEEVLNDSNLGDRISELDVQLQTAMDDLQSAQAIVAEWESSPDSDEKTVCMM